ncbi:hypothetical protein QFC20_005176 [Naganishia adeliensis]|uniref:Uncharacterized protein n=1 Tax=Naganishia adeliensis TaxID=92952 RepID=A0ACC2VRF1_9TREE|nr:hypothetical protein QFC20_005176 [Naganishia adeliensis]
MSFSYGPALHEALCQTDLDTRTSDATADATEASKQPSSANKMTIIHYMGPLSMEEEAAGMVEVATTRQAEDEAGAARIRAHNSLESYIYSGLKSKIIDNSTLWWKMSPEDQVALQKAVDIATSFLDGSGNASTEEIKKHHDDLKNVGDPILRRLEADKGATDGAGGMLGGAAGDVANKL